MLGGVQMSEYTKRVKQNLEGLDNVRVGRIRDCLQCDDGCDDGEFSYHTCDCCDTKVGGLRYAAHALSIQWDTLRHLTICEDCLRYLF